MKTPFFVAGSLACVSCLSALSQAVAPTPAPESHPLRNPFMPASATVQANYGKLPLSFEANEGQSNPQVKFISRGQGYSLYLTDSAAVLALTKGNPATNKKLDPRPARGKTSKPETPKTDVVRMELAGANPGLRVSGADQLPGKANYFIGNDPAKWHSNVPTYARVKYTGVYPGVDLVYYGNQRQLEYDFVLAPQADPRPVRLHFAGTKRLKLNADGDLTIIAKDGEIAFHKPVVYQTKGGQRQPVEGRFTLMAGNSVSFKLGPYDPARELVIDPTLAYSTYLGGNGGGSANAIAVDGAGNAYVTGDTFSVTETSSRFPVTENAFQGTFGTQAKFVSDAFVTKLNPAGSALIYSTYLSGSGGSNSGSGIQVDQSGDAYVAGQTYSTDFPVTSGAFQTTSNGEANGGVAFVSKLNPLGSALIYSTYLGVPGSPFDSPTAIAVDTAGHAFVTGSRKGGTFVTELNTTGSDLVHPTYLLPGTILATSIAVDGLGDAYITGYISSGDLPVTSGAFQQAPKTARGRYSGFVAKIDATGSTLAYSTYLGGSTNDFPSGIAVDTAGNAYIAGYTMSTDFPVTSGAFQQVDNATGLNITTIFVTKLNPTGSGLAYSTYLGGNGNDAAFAIAVNSAGNAFVTGYAQDSAFPTTPNAYQTSAGLDAANDGPAFLTELNSAGSALIYSTLFGSTTADVNPFGIAIDSSNNAYIVGNVETANDLQTADDLPITPGAFQSTNPTNPTQLVTGFIAKFALHGATATSLTSSDNPQTGGESVTFDAHVAPVEGTSVPTGIISFIVDGVIADHETLDGSGDASFTTSTLTVGPHTIVASYLGHNTVSSASSGALTQTITGQLSAPTFVIPGGTYSGAQNVSLETASPGATIYYTTGSAVPTTSSTMYTAPIAVSATTKINAIAVESPNTQSPVATATYTILPTAIATTTSIESSLNPSTAGQSVTFTATVTAASGPTPTGSVIFKHGSTIMGTAPLVAGIAQFTTSSLTSEAYEVIAVYTGSSTDADSHSPSVLQVVDPQ